MSQKGRKVNVKISIFEVKTRNLNRKYLFNRNINIISEKELNINFLLDISQGNLNIFSNTKDLYKDISLKTFH
tara:strand:- start:174 stop:392 length:219 start_codon:yes stop_codon:yes gene_type:complete